MIGESINVKINVHWDILLRTDTTTTLTSHQKVPLNRTIAQISNLITEPARLLNLSNALFESKSKVTVTLTDNYLGINSVGVRYVTNQSGSKLQFYGINPC
jgi:hypothetical protein